MNRNTRRFLLVLLVLTLSLTITAIAAASGHGQRNFRAHLNGGAEVPSVDTNAQGQVIVNISKDGSSISYKLIVANIENVVASHIHCAPAGVNGPVGVTLFSGGPISPDGTLAQDTVTEPNPGNACGWGTIGDVVDAINAGNAYVNVHTIANPPGEIRGQLH